jgi:hypothetical protein
MRFLLPLLALGLALPVAADPFGDHWYDGNAELAGYRITVDRYGEPREGTAVMIFVTEPFDPDALVKADRATERTPNVLKLNLVRDFRTGIYDYNTMVSGFFWVDRDFAPAKVTFSSAEWCGHVYEELLFRDSGIDGIVHSYFEGESRQYDLPPRADGVTEDQLFVLLRSLRGEFLASGESRTVPFLPGPFVSRLSHRPVAWTEATINRRAGTESVTVPAGTFAVRVYEVETDGRTGVFHIEDAYPHRIVRWEFAPDRVGELTGSMRAPYWGMNGNGDEAALRELGLEP